MGTTRSSMFCVTMAAAIVLGLSSSSAQAQYGYYHRGHHHTSHHHHDAMGHRIDDAGHHIDLRGHHTGAVGVYDNGAVDYAVPRTVYGGYGGYAPNSGYYAVPQAAAVVPTFVSPQRIGTTQPPQNALPASTIRPAGKITITNPADSGGTVSYALNGANYTIQPGYAQTIDNDRTWIISFGSGGTKGDLRYTLSPGLFKFRASEAGWDLARSLEQPVAAQSALPPPPQPMPIDGTPSNVVNLPN